MSHCGELFYREIMVLLVLAAAAPPPIVLVVVVDIKILLAPPEDLANDSNDRPFIVFEMLTNE